MHLHCDREPGYRSLGILGGPDVSLRALTMRLFRQPAVRTSTVAAALVTLAMFPIAARAGEAAYDSGGTGQAQQLLFDAQRAAYHGRLTEAVNDDTRAIELRPQYGDAFLDRADNYMEMGRYQNAADDLSRVIAMRPDDMSLGMMRVKLALQRADATLALAELKEALKLPKLSAQHAPRQSSYNDTGNHTMYWVTGHLESTADEYGSIAEQLLHQDDAALADMQRMLKLEAQYPEYILANYCYLAGVAGLLESAELMCEQSIEDNAHDIGQYDSLGFVHLRMKQWDKAVADYNKALAGSRSDLTLSLYGRGVARRALGDIAGGNADIAAATAAEPDIANIMTRLGAPTG
jgi:tetratricopeptide (TPR) repeat protein